MMYERSEYLTLMHAFIGVDLPFIIQAHGQAVLVPQQSAIGTAKWSIFRFAFIALHPKTKK